MILGEVALELKSAEEKFGNFASAHEGYAVILEELDELWDLVKLNPKKIDVEIGDGYHERQNIRHRNMMRKEAIQVAAMAVRFIKMLDEKDANSPVNT